MSVRQPPLHGENSSLACGYGSAARQCGEPAAWHLSWYDHDLQSHEWENSLACEPHKVEAMTRWDVGWRHRISPACGMPGSFLALDLDTLDDDGIPVSRCQHPFDDEPVPAAEADVPQLVPA